MNTELLQRLRSYPKHGQQLPAGATGALGSIDPNSRRTAPNIIDPTTSATVPQTGFNPNDPRIQQYVQQQADILARQMLADQAAAAAQAANGRVYTKFDIVNDIVDTQTEVVTAGMWSDGLAALTAYHTGSAQTTSQRRYYVDVYHKDVALTGSAVQYSLAYGHALGSGSDSQGQLSDSPSKAIYSQYKQLLLPSTDARFTTAGSGSTDSIYVINFKRNRLKERMDPGNFELPIANITSRAVNATGSVGVGSTVYTLIDDSSIASATLGMSGKVYNVVSGSLNSGVYNSSAPVYYGLLYPDHGLIILDGKMLDQQLGFETNVSSSSEGNNHFMLFNSISGSALQTNPATSDPYSFQARNSEKVTSTHYFVRIKNRDFNYSNNPSYVWDGTDGVHAKGTIRNTDYITDPKTYVTTVGLYNDNNELVAVAKLSRPAVKSFDTELLVKVRLDF